jgi:hypothetical protein
MDNLNKDFKEVTPDGKEEIVAGKEPLKKRPKNKLENNSKLKEKWNSLKKGLNNLEAIMDLKEARKPDEEDESEAQAQAQQAMQAGEPQEGQQQEEQEQPEEQEQQEEQEQPEEEPQQEEQPQEEPQEGDSNLPPENNTQHEDEDESGDQDAYEREEENKIVEALREEGYSEPEIALIVHGHHSAPYDESKEAKADATRAMAGIDADNAKRSGQAELDAKIKHAELEHQHAQRMKDLEYQHAQMQSPDPETENNHKKRMLDLEYENAKAQSPDGSDREHQRRMMDLEYQRAMAEMPDPEIAKKMAEVDLKERELQLQLKAEQAKLELEFKKREHELKLKMMEQSMKQRSAHKAEHADMKHKEKMKASKEENKLNKSEEYDLDIEDLDKSNYGPRGTPAGEQYSVEDNIKRKANNVGDVAGEGPNKNVKTYSSKAGQLSAKQQANALAQKQKKLNRRQPVKRPDPASIFTPEQLAEMAKPKKRGLYD